MITFTLAEILTAINVKTAELKDLPNKDHTVFRADKVTLDSRNEIEDALFIAIKGERFDGHDYVDEVLKKGAKLVIVNDSFYEQEKYSAVSADYLKTDKTKILSVPNTKEALGQIAALVRRKSKAKFVALTGSSGKTSVKEMTAAILGQMGKVLATKGNFNNEIGVPLTLLSLVGDEEYAVIELGANHQGEIAYTAAMTQPHSVLINSICQAHLEGFGSLIGVTLAKSEIFTYPNIDDIKKLSMTMKNQIEYKEDLQVILNEEFIIEAKNKQKSPISSVQSEGQKLTEFWGRHLEKIKQLTLFRYDDSDKTAPPPINTSGFSVEDISISIEGSRFTLLTPKGKAAIHLNVLGKHSISNALAATVLSMSVGASLEAVQKGLNRVQPVKGRLFAIRLANEIHGSQWIIDDTYNANVGSMKAAASLLDGLAGYKVFVAGDMAEMGHYSKACHEEIGDFIRSTKIDAVYTVGQWSQYISKGHDNSAHFESKPALINTLKAILKEHAIITFLVKGSRSSAMEDIVFALQER